MRTEVSVTANTILWIGRHFHVSSKVRSLCFVACLASTAVSAQQQTYLQDDIDRGAGLYAASCVVCHADGAGVPSVDLRSGQFRHATSDQDLAAVIHNGIPGTAMPAHADFSNADLVDIVAFIRTMRDYNSKPVKLGDPVKGKDLFENEGACLNCHRVNGKGSHLALDLSGTGVTHPAAFLQRALLDPQSVAAESPESHMVRAVTKSGDVITGRRLNGDTFTIQLMDDHEQLVSLEKSNLRSLTIVPGVSMPSLKGKFTDDQISDLVAYLVSLKQVSSLPIPSQGGGGGHP